MKSLAIFFICALPLYTHSFGDNILPIDAESANILLKAGILDSSEWQKIEPFYSMSISVPSGELNQLKNLYPEIDYELPVTDEELRKYEPWNKKKIEFFFKDFPQLVKFKPILNFYFSENYKAQVTFLNKIENCSLTYNRANFFIEPAKNVRFTARSEISNYNARWQNRLLKIKPIPAIEIQLGNVEGLPDKGLIIGNFPDSKKYKDSSAIANWIYGKNRALNGIKISYQTRKSQKKNCKVVSLIHKQPEELIAEFNFEMNVQKEITLTIGASELISGISDEKKTYFCGGIKVNKKIVKTEIYAGFDLNNLRAIPVVLNSSLDGQKRSVVCNLIYMPKAAEFNYSRLAYNLRSRSEADLNTDLTRITIQTKSNNVQKFKLFPEIELNLNDWDICRIDGTVRFSWVTNKVQWSSGISTVLLEDSVGSAKVNSELNYYPDKKLSLKWSSDLGLNHNDVSFLFSKNSIDFQILHSLYAGPSMELLTQKNFSDYSIQPGIISTLHFYNKSESQFQIYWPIKNKKAKGCNLECKAIFTF